MVPNQYIRVFACIGVTFVLIAIERSVWRHSRDNGVPFTISSRVIRNETQLLSSNRTTLVTALYDIGRERQGRSMDEYLQWIQQTLKLNCSLIIFTSRSLAIRIRKMRPGKLSSQTMIIERDRIPFEEFADLIELHIFPKFRPHMRHPTDITNTNKLYAIINHAKMVWMNEAIAINSFRTKTFFWIDAGFSRFIPVKYYMTHFPSSSAKIEILAAQNRAFVAVGSASDEELNISRDLRMTDFVGTNRNLFRGNFWGGHFDAVRRIASQSVSIFFDMLSHDIIDNEQISLFFAYRKQPDLFSLHRTASEIQSFEYIADG